MSCLLYYRAKQQNEVPPPPIQPTVSEHYYRRIFNTEIILGFETPRSDTCTKYDELAIAIDAADGPEKDSLEKEQSNHQAKAKAGYTMKREDKLAAKESWSGTRRRLSRPTLSAAKTVWIWFHVTLSKTSPPQIFTTVKYFTCGSCGYTTSGSRTVYQTWDTVYVW